MRSRISATVGAAALSLTLPMVLSLPAAHAAPSGTVTKKVAGKVTIDGYRLSGDDVKFRGKVKTKSRCLSGRTIKLRQIDDGVAVGKGRSNGKGKWTVTFDQEAADPGTFEATLTKKVVKTKRKRIVCKAATATYDA